jgi:hypothetical protein
MQPFEAFEGGAPHVQLGFDGHHEERIAPLE